MDPTVLNTKPSDINSCLMSCDMSDLCEAGYFSSDDMDVAAICVFYLV